MPNKLQLRPINKNQNYADLAANVAFNFAVLLDAYVCGSNAMLFEGEPGKAGRLGSRGASMLTILESDFKKAYRILYPEDTEDSIFSDIYKDSAKLATAITAILANPNATALLFDKQSEISSTDDLVNGDLLLFDNGKIVSCWEESETWIAKSDFPVSILTSISGMTREEIQKLIAQIQGDNMPLFSRAATLLMKNPETGEDVYLPNMDFKNGPIFGSREMNQMVNTCLWTCLKSTVSNADRHVFVLGSADFANEVFGKLAITPQNMPSGTSLPSGFFLQQRMPGKTKANTARNNKKFGMVFVDGDQVSEEIDPSKWKESDAIDFGQFAHITKDGDEFWISSHSDNTSPEKLLGRIMVSKEHAEMRSKRFRFIAEAFPGDKMDEENRYSGTIDFVAPYLRDIATYRKTIDSPNVQLNQQRNYRVLGTNDIGDIIDVWEVIEDYLTKSIANEFVLNEIAIRRRVQFDSFRNSIRNLHASEFLANKDLLLGEVIQNSKDAEDSSIHALLGTLKSQFGIFGPSLLIQGHIAANGLPKQFVESYDIRNIAVKGNSAIALLSDGSLFCIKNIKAYSESGNLSLANYVRINEFNVLAITASDSKFYALVKLTDFSDIEVYESIDGTPGSWHKLRNCRIDSKIGDYLLSENIKGIAVTDEILYIVSSKYLFSYHLQLGTLRTIIETSILGDYVINCYCIAGESIIVSVTNGADTQFFKATRNILDFYGNLRNFEVEDIFYINGYQQALCYAISKNKIFEISYIDEILHNSIIATLPAGITDVSVSGSVLFATKKSTIFSQTGIESDNYCTVTNICVFFESQKIDKTSKCIGDLLLDGTIAQQVTSISKNLPFITSVAEINVPASGSIETFSVIGDRNIELRLTGNTIDKPYDVIPAIVELKNYMSTSVQMINASSVGQSTSITINTDMNWTLNIN